MRKLINILFIIAIVTFIIAIYVFVHFNKFESIQDIEVMQVDSLHSRIPKNNYK